MTTKDTGGYAFPHTTEHLHKPVTAGMTLRDYFAAKAMAALSGCPTWREALYDEKNRNGLDATAFTAATAYKLADAMLKAREQA